MVPDDCVDNPERSKTNGKNRTGFPLLLCVDLVTLWGEKESLKFPVRIAS